MEDLEHSSSSGCYYFPFPTQLGLVLKKALFKQDNLENLIRKEVQSGLFRVTSNRDAVFNVFFSDSI
jgi:hypothetical protein